MASLAAVNAPAAGRAACLHRQQLSRHRQPDALHHHRAGELQGLGSGYEGYLSASDIYHQLRNPANTGDTAAAVATLANIEHANSGHLNFTPKLLGQYEDAYGAPSAWQNWDTTFQACRTT